MKPIMMKLHDIKHKKINTPMKTMLLGLGILFSLVFLYHLYNYFKMQSYLNEQKNARVTVSTTKVAYEDWQDTLNVFGSLRAVFGIDVTSEQSGIVQDIFFNDGADVKEGDALVQVLADADIALLESLQAQARLAEIVYNLDKEQFAINVVSQATLDTDFYTMKNAQALVDNQSAMVKKKTIRAPFDGKLGLRLINPGIYLNSGDPIVSLQNLDSLYVDFYVSERNIANLSVNQKISFITDAYPNKTFDATINAIEPVVDDSSRNLHIEAFLDNTDHLLLPGMYTSVTVSIGEPKRLLTIPQAAVSYNPYGNLVYVIVKKMPKIKDKLEKTENHRLDDKDKNATLYVEQKFVTLGDLRGDQVVVLSGLEEGDEIVTGGQLKLKNHSAVTINNEVVPTNDANPDVKDDQTI